MGSWSSKTTRCRGPTKSSTVQLLASHTAVSWYESQPPRFAKRACLPGIAGADLAVLSGRSTSVACPDLGGRDRGRGASAGPPLHLIGHASTVNVGPPGRGPVTEWAPCARDCDEGPRRREQESTARSGPALLQYHRQIRSHQDLAPSDIHPMRYCHEKDQQQGYRDVDLNWLATMVRQPLITREPECPAQQRS